MRKFISKEQWDYLMMRKKMGVPLGLRWGEFTITCKNCEQEFDYIRPSGTRGYTCPYCGYRDHEIQWILDRKSDGSRLMPV